MPPLCTTDTPNQLNQSFAAFYRLAERSADAPYNSIFRSLLEMQRLESDETREEPRKPDDLSDLDVSKFEELVSSLNPGNNPEHWNVHCSCYCCCLADKQPGDLFMNLKDSFSNFLRELSGTGTGTNSRLPELEVFPKQFSQAQELYSSNEPSSQEFDWNAIL